MEGSNWRRLDWDREPDYLGRHHIPDPIRQYSAQGAMRSNATAATNANISPIYVSTGDREPEHNHIGHPNPNPNPNRQNPEQNVNNFAETAAHLHQSQLRSSMPEYMLHKLEEFEQWWDGFADFLEKAQRQSDIPLSDWQDPGSHCMFCQLPVWTTNFGRREECGHFYHWGCYNMYSQFSYQNCSLCYDNTPAFIGRFDKFAVPPPRR